MRMWIRIYIRILPVAHPQIRTSAFYQCRSSSLSIRRWTYGRYCRSAMAQKLFSTGPGSFRRAEQKETIDDLETNHLLILQIY